jgi:hypothetical protein
MKARAVKSFPIGKEWMYEPKWDGFRCLVFRDHENIFLQSKAGKSLKFPFRARTPIRGCDSNWTKNNVSASKTGMVVIDFSSNVVQR